jgi:predicted metalloendopeptidase
MEFAVGRLYVSNYFDSNAKKHAFTMVNNLKDEFKIMLNEYDWMDTISKQSALEKAQMMDVKIGYPDFTYDDSYLNKIYSQVYLLFVLLV